MELPATDRAMLSPAQAELLASGFLDAGFSWVVQMPTGSGKTWLAEQAIDRVLAQGARAIYLTPLRALASELAARWQGRFGASRVGVFTGDYGAGRERQQVSFSDAQLLVMTPERLDACTRAWRTHWSWLPEVDLVVVDEFHLLGERQRGARLEGTLSRVTRLNPFLRLLCFSATLGNRRELADWLAGLDYGSDWRPIPLTWRTVHFRQAAEKPRLLAQEVIRNVGAGGKSLVFVQSRRRAEELGRYLEGVGLRARHHHAGLDRVARSAVEEGFRHGHVDALVATATLEMGLNLPVRQVILYDLQAFDGAEFSPLSTNTVWQRAGRAGRRGLDREGEVVLLAPAWNREADRYIRGKFEPIRSQLTDARALAEQIVTEVASGMARRQPQIQTIFSQSLAARQGELPALSHVIADMCKAGMLVEVKTHDDVRLRATRLGHIAVRHLLTPATVSLFQRIRESDQEFTFFDLLLVCASTDDCEPVLPVDFEELDHLAACVSTEPSRLLHQTRGNTVGLLGIDGKRLLSAMKMAAIARAVMRVSDVHVIAEQHGCYPFEIARLRESLSRLLTAMTAVLSSTPHEQAAVEEEASDEVSVAERARALQRMIQMGLDEVTATLTLVPGIGATLAKRLQVAGIEDIEELALAEPTGLGDIRGLSPARAEKWVATAGELISSISAFRYREAGARGEVEVVRPASVDPYRLRRALDLRVSTIRDGLFRVTGGLEPHQVTANDDDLICDCPDAAKGHTCKHELAVRLRQGDQQLQQDLLVVRGDLERPNTDALNLFDLWAGERTPSRGRKAP